MKIIIVLKCQCKADSIKKQKKAGASSAIEYMLSHKTLRRRRHLVRTSRKAPAELSTATPEGSESEFCERAYILLPSWRRPFSSVLQS